MAEPTNLKELYIEELQDLWSANDQMREVVIELAQAADDSLGDRLNRSVEGIELNTALLKTLIEEAGGQATKEPCKGMEGLVKEARKHGLDAKTEQPVRDVAIIAQFQRMTHYGIAGFGTAKAYARALNLEVAAEKLDEALVAINQSDDYMSELAERSRNLEAK